MEFLIECGRILLPLGAGFAAGLIPYFVNRNKRRLLDYHMLEQEQKMKENIKNLQLTCDHYKTIMENNVHKAKEYAAKIEYQNQELIRLQTEQKVFEAELESKKKLAMENFELQLEKLAEKYRDDEELCKQEYLKLLADYQENINTEMRIITDQKIAQ
jgi:predicted patatin/cPLA2 family phospholipase